MTDEEILRLLLLDPFDPFVGALFQSSPALPTDFPAPFNVDPQLPTIAGGSPDSPWEWLMDRVRNIIGGGYDILEAIGRIAADIVQGVWEWVGGAVRFVYDWLDRFSSWLGSSLSTMWGNITQHVWDAADWVRDRGWDVANWLKGQVDSAANFLGQALINTAGWRRDRGWEVGTWVGGRIWDGALWGAERMWEGARWVGDRVWDGARWGADQGWAMARWGGERVWESALWTRDRINDGATWTVGQVLPPIMGGFGDIGDAFRDGFDLVGGGIMDAGEALGDKLGDAFRWPFEHIAEPWIGTVENKLAIPGKLIRGEYPDFRSFLDDAMDPPPLVLAGIAGLLIVVQVVSLSIALAFQTYVGPLAIREQQKIASVVAGELLTVGQLQEAYKRGLIDEGMVDNHLSRHGYDAAAKNAIKDLRFFLPPPTDLIRMAVREVFDPEARARLTLDADFPEAFAQYAARQGFSRDVAEDYWAAHWDLPSPSQGYEMLHRGLIDDQELADLLKALDYAPVWRSNLQAISYNPITRVDLRRLYKAKVITEDDVFQGYKAIGYDDTNARRLTDFTTTYYTPEDKTQLDDFADLAVSNFRDAYRRHVITREAALDRIVEAGYTEDVGEFLLSIDDQKLALDPTTEAGIPVRDLTQAVILRAYREKVWTRERAQEELETQGYLPWAADLLLSLETLSLEDEIAGLEEAVVKEEYTKRVIDRAQASSRLDALEVGAERRDLLLRRWDLQAAVKTRELTVAQVQRGLKKGTVTETEALSRFAGMGFTELDANWLVGDVDEMAEGTARRLTVAQLSRAYKAGVLSDAQFLTAVVAQGYSQEDADVLLDIATPAAEDKVRQLSASQLAAGLRAGLVTEAEFLERVTAAGYEQKDAELLRDLALRQPDPPERKLSVAQLKELYKAETLDKAGVLAELLVLGYSERNAGWIRDLIAPAETTE